MGDLLNDPTSTLSIVRNSSLVRGNDDRDKVIANVVSSGQKVKVGRFMVQKSIVAETIEEEDEYVSDEYEQNVPIRRREKRKVIGDDTDDDKRSSWIERREAKIKRDLEKQGLLDYSSEESIPDGDTISWEEKEALLKQRASSTSSVRARASSSRPRAYSKRSIPDWDLGDDNAASSQVLVRPRASTLPFKPIAHTPIFGTRMGFFFIYIFVNRRCY